MLLYDELAPWWYLLSSAEEYAEEAALYDRHIREVLVGPARTLLELGSGGGNNASHLKARWDLTLVDLAPGMLANSRALNPECTHYLGDMRDVRLGRQFDAVFIHDAIVYLTTPEDLAAAVRTAQEHTRPGGVALLAPDHVAENFHPDEEVGGHDATDGRGLRYLMWSWDPDPTDSTVTTDYAYLLREPDGTTRAVHDRHIEGLFPRQLWLDTMRAAGFVDVTCIVAEHSDVEPGTYELFRGVRPA